MNICITPPRLTAAGGLLLAAAACLTSLAGCGAPPAQAPAAAPATPSSVVERLAVHIRQPAFGGQAFDGVGAYELIAGVATVRVDPRHPANREVVDLAAAAGADGAVRFQTDVVLLRPQDPARASKALIVELANRGNKLALGRLADGGNQMETAAQAGNGWPMRQGHTLAWVGWQGDVPLGQAGRSVGMQLPLATAGGHAITGRSVEEFVFDDAQPRNSVSLTYPAATLEAADAQLTVQAKPGAPATPMAASQWRYLDAQRIEITRAAGFDAGAVYSFTYTARDPRPMGLGLLALRDVSLWLKSGAADGAGQPNPLAGIRPDVTLLFGISQSGRALRDFVWQGFNAAPGGGRVFDGAMALIAGSRKSFTNARFAQPGRYSRQHEDHLYPGDQFPFSYATSTDPVSGRTDGVFARCEASATCPKLMHLDSNLEFWQARASLITSDGLGKPLTLPADVRAYLMASTQHGPATQPAAGICQQLNNPAQQAPLVRATLARLIDWARDGRTPPVSRFPAPGAGLVAFDRTAMGFPDLSPLGVRFPAVLNALNEVDASSVPPRERADRRYIVLLPRTDADGHDLDGVRLPEVAVPLATHSGFNLRRPGFAEGQLCGLNGLMVPLAATAAERAERRDPRPAIAERFATRSAYVQRVQAAADALRVEGLLLDEDVRRYVERARNEPRVALLPP